MRLADVPRYVEDITGIARSRQTVYNWATKGVKGNVLKTELKAGQMFTKDIWVLDFLAKLGERQA